MGPANPIQYVEGIPEWQPTAVSGSDQLDHSTLEGEIDDPGGFVMKFEHPPVPKREGRPRFLQTIAIGQKTGDRFLSLVHFGLADDGRATKERAYVTTWVSDGTIDYYGPFVRPNTPYDFKLKIDLSERRMTVWTSGRGDDDWFLLAEDVSLSVPADITQINHVQVSQYPNGPDVEGVRVSAKPYESAEKVQPHPLTKKNRMVGKDEGFQFQSMRSTWRKPGKHVTINRRPGIHMGFPDVCLAGPKHLVVAWRDGSHTGGSSSLSVAHSYDLGKTWSEAQLVTNKLHINCPRIQRLEDGTLLLFTAIPSKTYDTVFWDSKDGGKTWINQRWLRPVEAGGKMAIVPGRVLEVSDGSWLFTTSSEPKNPIGEGSTYQLDFFRSTDRGQTWTYLKGPREYPPYSICEADTIQLSDGRLFTMAREVRGDGRPAAKGFSTDGGKTWDIQDLPFPMTGRVSSGLLRDGRVMCTFRSGVGRAALWAWIGDPDDPTPAQPVGGHFNDRWSVGLKDGELHIDSDGIRGQFTKYNLKPPESPSAILDFTAEVKVLENQGRAATISIPFAGRLRLFPDHVEMSHDSTLRVEVSPGEFHIYRIVTRQGHMQLYVDDELKLDTDKVDAKTWKQEWIRYSAHGLGFGNEAKGYGQFPDSKGTRPDVYLCNIAPETTGYSIWRRVKAIITEPQDRQEVLSWSAEKDGFPDQYQLDHLIEVEASVNGHEQGYSGWIQLPDGRIFVAHYTDDTSEQGKPNPYQFGIPWIRGTFLELSDLPPAK
ncbi:MAG: sialidase family protein [Pirellulaceae bacterium]